MCIWAQHKRSELSQLLHRVSVESLHILWNLIFPSAGILAAVSDFCMVESMVNMRLLFICQCHEENNLMISPKRVWGQSKARERGRGEGNFVILNPKANSCYYWPVLFFCVWRGSCPFELFRRYDNGWMLRTYVERPLWLMEEEIHAGPAVWENTRPLLSLLTPQLMNAWMTECCYRPFRGQSPQEFTLAQTHPAMANTFV